jgi:carboxymethylenebutenolidase
MKLTLIAFALLLTASFAFAADAPAPGSPGGVPPADKEAKATLEKSPRHGEIASIEVPGDKTPVKSYVVHPEREGKVPVVIVIHDIYGMGDWAKAVADQLAADGFIAIVPDLVSGHGKDGGGSETLTDRQSTMAAVSGLKADEVNARLNAVRDYGKKLPASSGKTATIGFCWGGGKSFAYAVAQPDLDAAVVYYGSPPMKDRELDPDALAKVKAPVAGFYGGTDGRITNTVEPVAAEMKKLGKTYKPHVYDGAGHGFLRQQDGQNGANMKATQAAWPATIQFLREHTK